MQFIPDWAPNIHPMIVHFPLVLLIFAVLLDVAGLILKKFTWFEKSALLLYLLGTIAAILAFLSGRAASDGLDIPSRVVSAVNDHADWAEITLWFFIIFSVIRLAIGIYFKSLKKVILVPIVLTGLIGIYFLYQTADHGAKLVFGYGLGTGNITESLNEKVATRNESRSNRDDSTFLVKGNGSWKLSANDDMVKALSEKFKWIEGSLKELNPMYDQNESALMFHLGKEATTLSGFVYDNKIKSVQVTAKLDVNDLDGELEIIHHFVDKNNYDFLSIGKEEISLSRKSNGELKVFEKDKFKGNGWLEIKVVSDGEHFRGYVNNKMIVHGHGNEPKPGSVGMKFSGTGSINIKIINVESLKK